jgi:hypothetical protein
MPKFLNRELISIEIREIIKNAHKEVIMVVPYIKTSKELYGLLADAQSRAVEFLIIYREDCVGQQELQKLQSFTNLTLMNHPDVHAKCYLNETKMIISSMNLYDYSERNNREMGVLLDDDFFDSQVFQDALKEIRTIIKASSMQKKSTLVAKDGLQFKILEPKEDLLKECLQVINPIFGHKLFEIQTKYDEPVIVCNPYYEHIAAYLDYDRETDVDENGKIYEIITLRRIAIEFQFSDDRLTKVFKHFWTSFSTHLFDQYNVYWKYNVYWNAGSKLLTMYPNRKKHPQWNDLTFELTVKKFKQGLDLMIDHLKPILRSVK